MVDTSTITDICPTTTEGQLTGRLVITVEAVSNSAINVYYFIDPQVQGINDVTYTVSCVFCIDKS